MKGMGKLLKILAVDLGDARTGLAVCDAAELLAAPLTVVRETNMDRLLDKVAQAAKEQRAGRIVVGYPKNMNNTVGERAEKCAAFAQRLGKKAGIPTVLWDERGTTVSAHNYLNATDTRGKKRKQVVDAVAATIILESYLQYRKNGGE